MNYFNYSKLIDYLIDTSQAIKVKKDTKFIGWGRVECDGFGDGYDHFSLRKDLAVIAQDAIDDLDSIGVRISTSGGKRRPSHNANHNQTTLSLHILGRAFDLWVYGGGFWDRDDFVVEKGKRISTVWGKSDFEEVEKVTVLQWDHKKQKSREKVGRFINLTEHFGDYGFTPIPQRRAYPRSYGSFEWWHFQNTEGLVTGYTTFLSEALKVCGIKDLRNTNVWEKRNYVWNGRYFARPK